MNTTHQKLNIISTVFSWELTDGFVYHYAMDNTTKTGTLTLDHPTGTKGFHIADNVSMDNAQALVNQWTGSEIF